ncbi:hypothetical protein EYW49_03110 [Siculibacillus lacustris]|uniref:DUF4139 domain-containing protein n=1 Tax=Siculibacillus lacustris TaxID=1549641 RepID=A0A4Q9VWX0_9HYPH|nr:hypothetical protein [Siculibacillus lacustris]TBW40733.1 hypothetical protein EYW49_03110 [Siculibacillus lacustris]
MAPRSSPFAAHRRRLFAAVAVLALATATPLRADELPLTRVVLSTAGLAQFTRSGPVTDSATVDLTVRLDQVDDILKSLTVFDRIGSLGAVSLPGREPLDQLFRDLPFDRTALAAPAVLIDALVGSEITIKGPVEARGRVLRLVTETVRLPDGAGTQERHRLTLVTERGLVQAVLEEVTELAFVDPQTRAQIDRALAGLVENRAKDRRTVAIGLSGSGTRDVALSYVVPAPIWKTTWRLVLPPAGAKDATARLQGWAVLENLTGGDWTKVDLTLVSGNPVALHQPLYDPVFGRRQEVPVTGSAAPALPAIAARAPAAPPPMMAKGVASRAKPAPMLAAPAEMAPAPVQDLAAASSATAAVAEESSAQLLFHFPTAVTLATGHTMMVPFVDRTIAAERISFYRGGSAEQRPFIAARLKNDGDATLPPGIVTAFATGADGAVTHVGDALLAQLPRAGDQIVLFALDTKTRVRREDRGIRQTVVGTAADGLLSTTTTSRRVIAWEITAPPDEDRDVLLEEARADGWSVATGSDGVETTPEVLRRRVHVAKGQTAKAELAVERVDRQSVTLTSLPPDAVLAEVRGLDAATPAVKAFVARLAELSGAVARAEADRAKLAQERRTITEDQDRIRKNLQSAGAGSDLGRRFLDTLRQQEDRLAEITRDDKALVDAIAQRQKAIDELIRNLRF